MVETFITGSAFVTGTIVLVWVGYFAMRAIAAEHMVHDTKELAGSVIFRVSALHGLILALVFAQQMGEYRSLEEETVREASAIADIYFDIARHGSETDAKVIRPALSRYVDIVVESEWPSLGDSGSLSPAAWKEWETTYHAILDLDASTPRKAALRDHMLEDIGTIAETRNQRESHGLKSVSVMFWFAAISGVFLISLAYYCFTPTKHNVILISIFAAFTGIVMFFIYSFSNPFSPPGALQPSAFAKLQASDSFK